MASLRELLSKLPPCVAGGVAALGVAAAVFALVRGATSADPTAATTLTLKCADTACGTTHQLPLRLVNAQRSRVDGVEGAPGVPCPTCHKPTLRYAETCPNDRTVFFAEETSGECPKCGWDAAKAATERMMELAR